MTTLADHLDDVLARSSIVRILTVGRPWPGPALSADVELVQLADPQSLQQLEASSERFGLALVVGVLDRLSVADASALIARLRDLHASRLLVTLPVQADPGAPRRHFGLTDMLALGLEIMGEVEHAGERLELYGFDIARYKRTPDWLNARHWANPELWDRFRW